MDYQTKNKSYLGVMLLAICAISFVLEANAQANVDGFCANIEPASKPYCLKIIAGAKSWEQASMWTMNRLMRLMNRGVEPTLKAIEANLLPNIAPEKKAEIVKKCKDSYADVVKELYECKNLILRDGTGAYIQHVGVASISFTDCREAIVAQVDQPEIVELNKFNAHINKIFNVALSLANVDPRVMQWKTSIFN